MRAATECPREALMTEPDGALDLDAYLQRIGYAGSRAPSRATLDALHLAHATHIPFENLDILLGRPDPSRPRQPAGEARRRPARRLLLRADRALRCGAQGAGFRGHAACRARALRGGASIRPRTHMTLQVEVDGSPGCSPTSDSAFSASAPGLSRGIRRVTDSSRGRIASPMTRGCTSAPNCATAQAWTDLYAFTLERHFPVDYEMANHYTSTHPSSPFVQALTAQRLSHRCAAACCAIATTASDRGEEPSRIGRSPATTRCSTRCWRSNSSCGFPGGRRRPAFPPGDDTWARGVRGYDAPAPRARPRSRPSAIMRSSCLPRRATSANDLDCLAFGLPRARVRGAAHALNLFMTFAWYGT